MGRFGYGKPSAAALLTLMSWAQFWQCSAVNLGTETLLAVGTVEQTPGPISEALLVEHGEDNADSILGGDVEQESLVREGDVSKDASVLPEFDFHKYDPFVIAMSNLLKGGGHVDTPLRPGMTSLISGGLPIYTAIHLNNPHLLYFLLQHKVNLNIGDPYSPLVRAMFRSRGETLLKMLLEAGADPHFAGIGEEVENVTPLVLAIKHNLPLDTVDIFAPFINDVDESGSFTPLIVAVSKNKKDFVRRLLELGADPQYVAPSGSSAIHEAAAFDDEAHIEIMKMLLGSSKTHNEPVARGMKSLRRSAGQKVTQLKTSVDFTDENALEAGLEGSRSHAGHPQTIRDKLNIRDKDGSTPLFYAARYGNRRMIEYLIENGADIDIENNRGRRAKDLAQSGEIKQLLEKKA